MPTRERVDAYRVLRDEVERTVGQINGEYEVLGSTPDPLPAPFLPP